MPHLIEFDSEFGPIQIETNDTTVATRSFATSDTGEKAKVKFEESLEVLERVSRSVVGNLKRAAKSVQPDEVEVKLGLKFSAEAGAFIAKAGTEGALEVVMKWKNVGGQ